MTKFSIKDSQLSTLAKAKMMVKVIHQKVYHYDSEYLQKCLIKYAGLADDTSISAFLRTKENIAKSSFAHFLNKSGLAELKRNGTFDLDVAKALVTNFFEKTSMQCSERTAAAHAACRYLTEHEEHSLVQFCTVLGNMGYGLTRDDLHSFADSIVNENVDKREHVSISKHVTEGILTQHKDLIKIVAAASLDTKRAKQATADTRDAVFCKLNSYVKMLFAMKKIPWQMYDEIPANSIYNMDELGNDTTKHRNKVLCKKTDSATMEVSKTCTFMCTSEGDGQMPWHITICLTT